RPKPVVLAVPHRRLQGVGRAVRRRGRRQAGRVRARLPVREARLLPPGPAVVTTTASGITADIVYQRALAPYATVGAEELGAVYQDMLQDDHRARVILTCIFGIDIDPVAVDLAKLALSLETAGAITPSMLDRHIICGNTLAGVTPPAMDDRRRSDV